MNQTVTVNISGIVFNIEVDAHDQMKNYLNKIKSYFKNSEECDEIMTDIEARIAELFSSKLSATKQVINEKDVDAVIEIMGKTEQYIDDEDEFDEENLSSNYRERTDKRMFRNPDDRIIGGVSSGIATYFGIDSVWVRLLFVVAFFVGCGFILYILLWIVIPEAKTSSEKLQMKGEPINIKNIGKTIEDEAGKVNEKLKNINTGKYAKKAESAFESFFNALFQVIKGIFKVFGKVVGVVFLIVGTFWLVALIGMLLGSETIFSITSDGIFSVDSGNFFNLIFVSQDQFYLALFGLVLAVGIPIIAIIYAGVKLLFKIKTHISIGIGLFVLWVVGIATCALIGIRMGTELTFDESVTQTEQIDSSVNDFVISASTKKNPGKGVLEEKVSVISLDEDSIYQNFIKLRIYKSESDSTELKLVKSSNGNSRKGAMNNAKSISYNYVVQDSLIFLNNYFSTLKKNKIRCQEIKVKLYLPIGKSIYLDKSLKRIIHKVDNVTDTWDPDMLGKKWVMLKDGLTCLDCDDINGITSNELDSIRTFQLVSEEIK